MSMSKRGTRKHEKRVDTPRNTCAGANIVRVGGGVGQGAVVAGGDARVQIVNVPSRPLKPRQIGEPVGDFVGRTGEIRNLLAAFKGRGEKRGAVISGVRGMGGVGKTELAKMAAKRLKKQFPDGQIFFNLRGARDDDTIKPATPAEALQHVVQSFRPDLKLPESVGPLQGFYHSVLDGKRVLLLLDNALNGQQLTPLIPPPDGCVLLVTSRRRAWRKSIWTRCPHPRRASCSLRSARGLRGRRRI